MADEAQPKVTSQETKGGRRKAAPSVSAAETPKQTQETPKAGPAKQELPSGLVVIYH